MRVFFHFISFLSLAAILLFTLDVFSSPAIEDIDKKFLQNTPAEVDSLDNLAYSILSANLEQSRILATLALKISRKINYNKGITTSLLQLGSIYFSNEDYYKSFSCFFECLDLYEKNSDIEGQLKVLGQIAAGYLIIHDPEKALIYIRKAELISRDALEPKMHGNIHLLSAKYYYEKRFFDIAQKETYLSIFYFNKDRHFEEESEAYKFLGDIFLQKKQFYKSIYNYQLSIQKIANEKNLNSLSILYTRIAHVYQLLSDYRTVLKYNFNALRAREKSGNQEFIASSLINIGASYLKIPEFDSSLYYLRTGLTLAKSLKKNYMLENAYLQLYYYYMEVKDYQQALKCYENYTETHRRVLADRNNSDIQKLEAGRLIRDAENQNEILKKGNDIQRLEIRSRHIQTFFFEILILAAAMLVIFIYNQQSKHKKSRMLLHSLNQRLENEIREKSEADKTLRKSEELYRFMAENSMDVISHLDRNYKRLYISPSCQKLYGYEQEEMYRMNNIFQIIHPDYQQIISNAFSEMQKTKQPIQFSYLAIRKDGSEFWAESVANPIIDESSGEVKEMITVVRDVSIRKKHEEELSENARQKEILLREIHHRVKNNFAVMTSLMNMQKEISSSLQLNQALSELQLRIRTMSLVHEQLYLKDNIHDIRLGEYLLNLANIISDAFNNQRISLHTDIDEGVVNIEMALPLGLIVNELLTNCYKYAFPGQRKGNINIRLKNIQNYKETTVPGKYNWDLIIQDDGIGLPPAFVMDASAGMGSQIVQILVEQIEAKLEVSHEIGATFRIQFTA